MYSNLWIICLHIPYATQQVHISSYLMSFTTSLLAFTIYITRMLFYRKTSAKSSDVKLRRSHSLGSRRKKTSLDGGASYTQTGSVVNLSKREEPFGSSASKQIVARGRSPTTKVTLTSTKDIRSKLSRTSNPRDNGKRSLSLVGILLNCA